jgi:ferredoxin
MRLVVDLNRCRGFAECAFLAPDVFVLPGDEALAVLASLRRGAP